MRTMKPLLSAMAIVAIGAGITACNPIPGTTGPGKYVLQAMPTGTVTIVKGSQGTVQANVDVYGLTPGSAHSVFLTTKSGRTVPFSTLTADATGQADTTLTSTGAVGNVRGDKLVILLGTAGGGSLADERIGQSGTLSRTGETVSMRSVSPDGMPAGGTAITYDQSAQTLTITVTAYGLTPGAHAAHIHLGSCQDQGAVKYMIPDFIADSSGVIVDQTRVVTGVTSFPGPGNWYLNLHMGGMNQILANGNPTLYFRPMLCTNITSVAVTGNASSSASPTGAVSPSTTASPSGMPSSSGSASPSASMSPSSMPSMTSSPSPSASPSGATATPSPSSSQSTAYPTHY
jgi:Cu/Zn superoxide dismutase